MVSANGFGLSSISLDAEGCVKGNSGSAAACPSKAGEGGVSRGGRVSSRGGVSVGRSAFREEYSQNDRRLRRSQVILMSLCSEHVIRATPPVLWTKNSTAVCAFTSTCCTHPVITGIPTDFCSGVRAPPQKPLCRGVDESLNRKVSYFKHLVIPNCHVHVHTQFECLLAIPVAATFQ